MDSDTDAVLTVTGTEVASESVSVEVLVHLLQGFQQLALVFAAAAEDRPLHQRFKPPLDLRQRYHLRCGVSRSGSYSIPLRLVDSTTDNLLPNEDILPRIAKFIGAVAAGDRTGASTVIPDSRYRDRALLALRSMAPRKGERWKADLQIASLPPVSLNGGIGERALQLRLGDISEETQMTVTGEFIAVNFEQCKVVIRYPPNKRELECFYLPELEVDLLESRRDLIQVTGTFTVDEDGHPRHLTGVNKIEAVDLSPIELDTLEHAGHVLKADSPLRLAPRLDEETQQLYVVEDASLDIHVFAYTREDLITELGRHVFYAWNTYAQATPSELTEAAQRLRETYRRRFREVGDAEEQA